MSATELSSMFEGKRQVHVPHTGDNQDPIEQTWIEDEKVKDQGNVSDSRKGQNSARLESDKDDNVNSNNNNSSNNTESEFSNSLSCTESGGKENVCPIEVIKNSRKEEQGLGEDKRDFLPCGKGVNNNNNIVCSSSQLAEADTEKARRAPSVGAMAAKKPGPGCDSSNNNKCISKQVGGTSCIVDHLVMEVDPTAVSTDSKAVTESHNTYTQKEGTAEVVTSDTVTPEVSFSDPRQSQVFQMLTGVQQLRKNDTFADVTVLVKDVDFRCHSFVLATNSPILHAALRDCSLASSSDANHTQLSVSQNDVKGTGAIEDQTEPRKTPAPKSEGNLVEDPKKLSSDRNEKPSVRQNVGKDTLTSKTSTAAVVPVAIHLSKDEKGQIVLRGLEPDIFTKLLDFMYCRFEDMLTEENCLELLLAAESVQMPYLRRTCASYVTDTLSAANVFRVIQLCDSGYASLFQPRILKRAHQVIRENFPQLSSADDFLSLGRHVMIPLLADSMLHTRSEMDVLQALLRWVKARPEERCSDMTLMLQHVRFPLMSSRELEKLREVPLLKQNSLAMALIEESRIYGNLDYNERMAWPRHNCISRCLFSTRDLILWTADRDKGLHFYSIIDGQHHKVTSFGQLAVPQQRSTSTSSSSSSSTSTSTSSAAITSCTAGVSAGNFSFDSTSSVCCYGDKIFFTGGEFNTDMVWSVDTGSGEVKVHAKMPRGRKFHSMVASKGCVYCLGGQDKRGYTVLEDVDAYIINKDVWVKVGHLAVPAYNMSAAVSGGAVYLVGGFDHSGQPLRLIQCFIALRSGLYSAFKVEISNMPPSLLSARAVACGLDKTIYIVCGHGEVYQFEPDRQGLGHVTTLRNLSENPRVRFGLAYVGGCLVVIGGHQLGHVMHEPIRSVCLDIASKTEVRDYSPLLPGDIVNTCLAAKLSSNILRLFNE